MMPDPTGLPPEPSYRVKRQGMDPGTKRLATIAVGLAFVLVVIGLWPAMHHHSGQVPLVMAEAGPVRVKPDNPGGLQIGASNEDISASGSTDHLTAPPEQPDTADLQARLQAARPEQQSAPAANAANAGDDAEGDDDAQSAPGPAVTPGSGAAMAGSATADTPPSPAGDSAGPRAETPASTPANAAAPAAQAVAKPKTITAQKAPPSSPADMHETPGHVQVQLAALDSEQAALAEWGRLQKQWPGVLAGRKPSVMRVEREGKTFFRLRTGGFTDAPQATRFCATLREKGAACSVANF